MVEYFTLKNQFKNEQNAILVQNYSSFLISISLLYIEAEIVALQWVPLASLYFRTWTCGNQNENAVYSRVGDRPTATILQVQFHFVIFAWFFNAKYSTKICPS